MANFVTFHNILASDECKHINFKYHLKCNLLRNKSKLYEISKCVILVLFFDSLGSNPVLK